MFQSFTETSESTKGAERAAATPRQAERDGARRRDRAARRRAPGRVRAEIGRAARWLTGFSGSAGIAVVLPTRRRCSSTGATRCRRRPGRRRGFRADRGAGDLRSRLAGRQRCRGAAHRLRPVADDARAGDAAWPRRWRPQGLNWSPSRQSGGRGLDRPARAGAGAGDASSRRHSPAGPWRKRSPRSPSSSASSAPMPRC